MGSCSWRLKSSVITEDKRNGKKKSQKKSKIAPGAVTFRFVLKNVTLRIVIKIGKAVTIHPYLPSFMLLINTEQMDTESI